MAELVFNVDNTALETVRALTIKANFEEMEAELQEAISPYEHMVVTEDDLPQAKTDRARLNKVLKNIGEHRKMVKRFFMEPYELFEQNCKRLTAICDRGIANLDSQIKEYENAAKAKKMQMLHGYFDSLPKKHGEYADFSECENPKWANVTYSVTDAMREIENYVLRVDTDVEALLDLESKYEHALLEEYQKTGDISAALMLKQRLERSDKIMEEKRKAAAEENLPTAPIGAADESSKYSPCSYNIVCRRQDDEDALFAFCVKRGLTITKGGNVL